MRTVSSARDVQADHSRHWRDHFYVYPVISRRSKGLSIGVNLNPDAVCNFGCVYCQIDRRSRPDSGKVDLTILDNELRKIAGNYLDLFHEPEFATVPDSLRRLNDFAFSGDGEPTSSPVFPQAARCVAGVRREFQLLDAKIVLITNACFLMRPRVAETLAFLDGHRLEVWAKLDAGTEQYFQAVNRSTYPLQHVLDNILAAARVRPIVIQSLFLRLNGAPPPADEITAYFERLRWLGAQGGQIALVQLYTVARPPAEQFVAPLTLPELEAIAVQVRTAGIPAECFA